MNKLDHRELTLIKRAAEDAIHACNRHYGPFVDVVAHPLNIIALVEMAQSRQVELADKDQRIHELNETSLDLEGQINKKDEHAHNLYYENANLQTLVEEKDKRISELEKSEFALAKVKQILNKHIKTKLLESIIVRELIDLLFSNKG